MILRLIFASCLTKKNKIMKKSAVILIHVVFWLIMSFIAFFLVYMVTALLTSFAPKAQEYNPFLDLKLYKTALFGVGIMSAPFYISYFLMPIFIRKTKLIILPVTLLILFYVFTVISEGNNTYKFFDSAITIVLIVFIVLLGCLFRILTEWLKNLKIKTQLEKQNLQSELALLKNQVSPHFFFNTLNNIDSLIKSNTDKASETLVKLSEIMRYMIYDTNIDKVDLSNEIKHIESYIDLQKIQYSNKELISFAIKGNFQSIRIAPMLFIPFVENAFKHCTDKSIQNAIRIAFSIDNNTINFECVNVFDRTRKITKDNASGIGLAIIKRRLEIIYPDKHTLTINEVNNTFKVILTLNINEN